MGPRSEAFTGPAHSGKTALLADRVTELVAAGISPRDIAVLGMSLPTVALLRFHLEARLPASQVAQLRLGTIHRLCADYIVSNNPSVCLVDDLSWRQILEIAGAPLKLKSTEAEKEPTVRDFLRAEGYWRYDDFLVAPPLPQVVVIDDLQDVPPRLDDVVRSIIQGALQVIVSYNTDDASIYDFLGALPAHAQQLVLTLPVHLDANPRTSEIFSEATADEHAKLVEIVIKSVAGGYLLEDLQVVTRSHRESASIASMFHRYGIDTQLRRWTWPASSAHIMLAVMRLLQGASSVALALVAKTLDLRRGALMRAAKVMGGASLPQVYKGVPSVAKELDQFQHDLAKTEPSYPGLISLVDATPGLKSYVENAPLDQFHRCLDTHGFHGFTAVYNDVVAPVEKRKVTIDTAYRATPTPLTMVTSKVGGPLRRRAFTLLPRVYALAPGVAAVAPLLKTAHKLLG